jgi:hypothetical protein
LVSLTWVRRVPVFALITTARLISSSQTSSHPTISADILSWVERIEDRSYYFGSLVE